MLSDPVEEGPVRRSLGLSLCGGQGKSAAPAIVALLTNSGTMTLFLGHQRAEAIDPATAAKSRNQVIQRYFPTDPLRFKLIRSFQASSVFRCLRTKFWSSGVSAVRIRQPLVLFHFRRSSGAAHRVVGQLAFKPLVIEHGQLQRLVRAKKAKAAGATEWAETASFMPSDVQRSRKTSPPILKRCACITFVSDWEVVVSRRELVPLQFRISTSRQRSQHWSSRRENQRQRPS